MVEWVVNVQVWKGDGGGCGGEREVERVSKEGRG